MDLLGWIDAPRHSLSQADQLVAFADRVSADGLRRVLVCGMGGSSLVARVLASAFGNATLDVLDSTDPATVLAAERASDPAATLYLMVSKSGTTVETMAAYRYFAARARPDQFVAITDPGTPLEALARATGFRAVFPHPVDVGGRYAALTVVGMLPAALMGIDGRALLERALAVDLDAARLLGFKIGAAVAAGRNKLLLRPPAAVAGVASWIEQLVAESSGKKGQGVIPVVGGPEAAAPDTQSVYDFSTDPLDLGAEFLRWEHATRALCEMLGVNAFDQPDVEAAKVLARSELERDPRAPLDRLPTLTVQALRAAARPGDYFAILAYLPATPAVEARLETVRAAWARALGVVTTLGFGPRYLHSTGQLHKGGPNTGLFLVVTADDAEDVDIPGMGRTFGHLKRAQALGDIRALLAKGRRVAHVHLARPGDVGPGALSP
jgi:transaldolase/glucose-6-phosphate isomerase